MGIRGDIMDPAQHYIHSENRGAISIYDSNRLTITGPLTLATSGGDGL